MKLIEHVLPKIVLFVSKVGSMVSILKIPFFRPNILDFLLASSEEEQCLAVDIKASLNSHNKLAKCGLESTTPRSYYILLLWLEVYKVLYSRL